MRREEREDGRKGREGKRKWVIPMVSLGMNNGGRRDRKEIWEDGERRGRENGRRKREKERWEEEGKKTVNTIGIKPQYIDSAWSNQLM